MKSNTANLHKRMEKDNETVHIYFSTDIARDGITDCLVRVTKFNHITKNTEDKPHVFSVGATFEQKNDPAFIVQQSQTNLENGNKFFEETYNSYQVQGYVEKPTLYDTLQTSVSKVRDRFFTNSDNNKLDIK